MRRALFFVLCLLFLPAYGSGQSNTSDLQGMQALVAEVRQLRKDLQTTNGYALKAQVLLYRLQVQEAAVGRASQHLNDLRSRLAETQAHRRDLAAALKRNEEFIEGVGATDISPADRKQVQSEISRLKVELDNLATEEQQRQSAEMEAEEQLRLEQAKLSGLEDRLDRLEKELGNPH